MSQAISASVFAPEVVNANVKFPVYLGISREYDIEWNHDITVATHYVPRGPLRDEYAMRFGMFGSGLASYFFGVVAMLAQPNPTQPALA